MKTTDSFLRGLQAELKRQRPVRRKSKTRHCDEGHPIDLRYDDSFYSAPCPNAHAASRGMARDSFAIPFEDEEEDPYAPAPWGTGEMEEEKGNFAVSRSLSDEPEAPVWGTGELEALETSDTSRMQSRWARATSEEEPSDAPVWGTGQLEEEPTSVAEGPPSEQPSRDEPPLPAAAASLRAVAASVPRSTDPETAAFQDDLKAILAGKKAHPSTADPAAEAASARVNDDALPPTSAPAATGHTHQVFERMAPNMSLATTYNLGSFELDRQMDRFDRQLDRDERASERRREQARTPRAAASPKVSANEFAEDLAAMTRPEPPASPRRAPLSSAPRGGLSHASNAVVVPVATTILGGVMTRLVEGQGDVTWELEQLKGLKRPGDDPANTGDPHFKDRELVFGGPIAGNIADDISADFRIRYQFNGRSLGNIQITNDGVNDAVGWALSVKAQIMDDAKIYPYPEDPTGFAAVRVVFTYRFTRTVGSDHIAERVVMLFGDGNHTETVRWIQNETLSLPVTASASRAEPLKSENPS